MTDGAPFVIPDLPPGIKAARRFAKLTAMKKAQKEGLKEIQDQMDALVPVIEDFMIDSGLSKFPFEDLGVTVYSSSTHYAALKGDPEDVHETPVTASDVGNLLRGTDWQTAAGGYNAQSLSALVNEAKREGQPLPDGLEELIDVKLRTSMKCVKLGN